MPKYLVIILTAVGITILGGFLIKSYGTARYDEGYNKAVALKAAASVNAGNSARIDLESIKDETHNLDDDDINSELVKLGIMRRPTDY